MRAHYLQHVPFEGLGSIEQYLIDKEYTITSTRLYLNEELPTAENIDLLIIMGGPMSVNDEEQYPWLNDEKSFIQTCLKQKVAILGVCLGAQLIASAAGAEVYPNHEKEIGWFPIYPATTKSLDSFCFPAETTAFHWHGETFSLPPDSVHLAGSKACKHQAFQLGTNVIGLQFHLETTPTLCKALIDHCGDELVPGNYIQSGEDLLKDAENHYASIHKLMSEILEYLQGKLPG